MNNDKMLNSEFIKSLGESVTTIVEADLTEEAMAFAYELEAACERNKQELALDTRIKSLYRKYIIMLKYIALPLLKQDEIITMLKTNLLVTMEMYAYDLYKKIEERAKKLETVEEANAFRLMVQDSLFMNNEIVSNERIAITGNEVNPSVANWLKDYGSVCSLKNKDMNCLQKYLLSSVNVKKLPEEKLNIVKSLLYLFERLKIEIDAINKQDMEVTLILPDGTLGNYSNGKVTPIVDPVNKNLKPTVDYKLNEKEKRAIEKALIGEDSDIDENEVDIDLSIENSKKEILDFLETKLFKAEYAHPSIENAINIIMINTLVKDLIFKVEMERTLYQNKEQLTSKKFIIDKREQLPSIRNWLRCFIEERGSGIFNNLELTKFISESPNAKILDDTEKKLLAKLLRVYRSIKFFPQSMENLPPDQWEIIPIDKKEVLNRAVNIERPKATGRDALLDELKGNVNDYAEGSLEREILEEESEKDREYHKLLLLMKKYPEGSLERRAVEEEIKKLQS